MPCEKLMFVLFVFNTRNQTLFLNLLVLPLKNDITSNGKHFVITAKTELERTNCPQKLDFQETDITFKSMRV